MTAWRLSRKCEPSFGYDAASLRPGYRVSSAHVGVRGYEACVRETQQEICLGFFFSSLNVFFLNCEIRNRMFQVIYRPI